MGQRGEPQLGPTFLAQMQDPPPPPTTTQVSAEAAVFVAVSYNFTSHLSVYSHWSLVLFAQLNTTVYLNENTSLLPPRDWNEEFGVNY